MNYTLIAYKPDSFAVSYGCTTDRYSSEHRVFCTDDETHFIHAWADVLVENMNLGHQELGYDITLLINGVKIEDLPDTEWVDVGFNMQNQAEQLAAVKNTERNAELEAKKARNPEEKEQRQREADQRELARLQAKLGKSA